MSAWLARLAVGSPSSSRRVSSSSSASAAAGGAASTSTSSPANKHKFLSREEVLAQFVKRLEVITTSLTLSPEQRPPTLVIDLFRSLDHLLHLLTSEQQSPKASDESLGACLEHLLKHSTLNELVKLVLDPAQPRGVRCELVKWFDRAITQLHESFLVHNAVNKPLVKLLRACVDEDGGLYRDEELAVVEVMASVSTRIQAYPELLAIFLREKPPVAPRRISSSNHTHARPFATITITDESHHSNRPDSPTPSTTSTFESSASMTSPSQASSSGRRPKREHDFLLFAYLLRFVHREGPLGDRARVGLLKLVEIAIEPPPSTPLGSRSPPRKMHRSDTMGTLTPETFASSPTPPRPPPPLLSTSGNEARLSFAEFLLDSDFADVLGAGLGALYGLLPSKLVVRSAGSASTAEASASIWSDPIPTSIGGGMVLGGMGALGEDEDEEELRSRREGEEMRLRSLGVGLTGTDEFRQSLDGFLKLFEFIQDVVRTVERASNSDQPEFGDDLDDPLARERRLVVSALSSTIFASLRTSFLQSVLYPSILECDETDGSAVAVMSYLDAMLDVLDEGSELEAALLGFLMGEEDAIHVKTRQQRRQGLDVDSPVLQSSPSMPPADEGSTFLSPTRVTAKSSLQRVKRRKSNALILLEKSTERGSAGYASYFTSYGRFTIKDLLVANVHSTSQPTATAALKLLQTMLQRHDRWSVGLLDVVLDDAATSFPIVLRQQPRQEEVEVAERNGDDSDDDDSDVFVYPVAEDPAATLSASKHTITPARARTRLLLGPPLPATPSVTTYSDVVDTLMALVGSIDPAYRSARAVGGGSEMLSSGYSNYLRDAEVALADDLAFQRGLAKGHAERPPSPIRTRLSGLFGPVTTTSRSRSSLSPREFGKTETMYRHRVDPDSATLVALVLDSLTHFFSHSPDLNLALTAVITSFAVCPYRSLEGWLLPPTPSSEPTTTTMLSTISRGSPEAFESDSDDGDDRSIDFDIASPIRTKLASPTLSRDLNPFVTFVESTTTPFRATLADSDSVLAILDLLVQSVRHYRATIPHFDSCLAERRKGLFFVENLADALSLDDLVEGGNAFIAPRKEPTPTPIVSPPPTKPALIGHTSSFMGALGFSTPTRSKPTRTEQIRAQETPTNGDEVEPGEEEASSTGKGPASPFAAHYRQTGSISVQPIVVATPRTQRGGSISPEMTRGGLRKGTGVDDEEEEEEVEDSPTRRISPRPGSPHPSTTGTRSPPLPSMKGDVPPRSIPRVSLSTILDNVIVLEEFIKELAGIVCVRRSAGIDAVSFL